MHVVLGGNEEVEDAFNIETVKHFVWKLFEYDGEFGKRC